MYPDDLDSKWLSKMPLSENLPALIKTVGMRFYNDKHFNQTSQPYYSVLTRPRCDGSFDKIASIVPIANIDLLPVSSDSFSHLRSEKSEMPMRISICVKEKGRRENQNVDFQTVTTDEWCLVISTAGVHDFHARCSRQN